MEHFRFLDGSVDRGLSLPGSYDPALVALSILIASLAAYSAFGLAERISASGKPAVRRLWLAAGAVAMGLGVWAMHFIAMLAFRLPVPVNYDVLTTLLSILPAIVAAGIVLLATTRARTGRPRLLLSGALMGIGIGTMHYTGMAAMRMAAVMLYDPVLFVLSLIVAFLLATAALYTKLLASGRNGHSRHYRTKLAAASIMGLAIAGMHYTGMAASYFFPTSDSQVTAAALDPMVLGVLVSLAAVLLLALVICVTGVDARLKGASAKIEHELKVAQSLLDEAKQRVDGPLLGESVAVRALREAVVNYAATNETLLLTGPPGAGQEAVARAIHHESRRASRAFIHVNCAMLQTSQLSTSSRALPSDPESSPPPIGEKFRLADGGTLYLENVDKLSLGMRDQLAEALQELEQQRKRGQPLKPDVRVIAYTSINLAEEGKGFRFSPALDQSLCKRQLSVPALAERREDIPVLVQYFIQHYARRLGKTVEVVSEASMERLQAYRWAGNIRELQNLIERVIVTAGGPVLEIDQSLLGGGISLDRYRLVRLLGRGGMGEVWLAKHQLLARPAAVKLICSDSLGGPERTQTLIKRFQREAQITANLNSPNTVKLYDFGVSETGSFYLVMELLSGIDLESMVNRLFLETAARKPGWQIARCAAVLTLNTTMRGCELKSLKWRDVDLFERVLTIHRQGTKTDAGARVIPLNRDAVLALAELKDRGENLAAAGLEHFILPACEHGHIQPDKPMKGWRTAWRSLTRAAGLQGLRPHDLRHHVITELSEKGLGEETIMSLAGHVSREMLSHYSHIRLQAKRRAVEALETPLLDQGQAVEQTGPRGRIRGLSRGLRHNPRHKRILRKT